MLYKGKRISEPNKEYVVIPRPDEDIVFTAQAVLDTDDFDQLFPRPTPPTVTHRDGTRAQNPEDSRYKAKLDEWGIKRTHYLVIKSLQATEELEWETIDFSDPDTWGNYETELKESGFTQIEIQRIIMCAFNANSLNESKIEEARRHFLAGLQVQSNGHSSHKDDLTTTPSGEPAND